MTYVEKPATLPEVEPAPTPAPSKETGIVSIVTAVWKRYKALPAGVRAFVTDLIESGVGAFVALNLAFPTSSADLRTEAAAAAVAVAAAVISTARRELPNLVAAIQAAQS